MLSCEQFRSANEHGAHGRRMACESGVFGRAEAPRHMAVTARKRSSMICIPYTLFRRMNEGWLQRVKSDRMRDGMFKNKETIAEASGVLTGESDWSKTTI